MFRVYMRIKDASYEVVNEGYFDDQKFFGPENELITQMGDPDMMSVPVYSSADLGKYIPRILDELGALKVDLQINRVG